MRPSLGCSPCSPIEVGTKVRVRSHGIHRYGGMVGVVSEVTRARNQAGDPQGGLPILKIRTTMSSGDYRTLTVHIPQVEVIE